MIISNEKIQQFIDSSTASFDDVIKAMESIETAAELIGDHGCSRISADPDSSSWNVHGCRMVVSRWERDPSKALLSFVFDLDPRLDSKICSSSIVTGSNPDLLVNSIWLLFEIAQGTIEGFSEKCSTLLRERHGLVMVDEPNDGIVFSPASVESNDAGEELAELVNDDDDLFDFGRPQGHKTNLPN